MTPDPRGRRVEPEIRTSASSDTSDEPQHRVMLPPPDEWDGNSQRYECAVESCENTVLLPEHPRTGAYELEANCPDHGETTHTAIGRSTAIDITED